MTMAESPVESFLYNSSYWGMLGRWPLGMVMAGILVCVRLHVRISTCIPLRMHVCVYAYITLRRLTVMTAMYGVENSGLAEYR